MNAAVAVAFAMVIPYRQVENMGGRFMPIRLANGDTVGLDYRKTPPLRQKPICTSVPMVPLIWKNGLRLSG